MGSVFSLLASLAPASLDIRLSNAPADDGQAENQDRAGTIKPFLVIFGSANRPWNTENWTEVSDTVRGGQSKAVMKYIDRSDRTAGVSLEGMLDTKTLGGAGFASQVYRHPISLPMAGRYSAFFLEVEPVEESLQDSVRTFTFGARDRPLGSPNESALTYQFDFQLPLPTVQRDSSSTKLDQLVRISIPFNALVPTFRGRPKSDEKPFDPRQITQISFMARSFFNHQSGPFLLNIRRLGVE